jgi:tetratricopeptide (TPR) repeat protein
VKFLTRAAVLHSDALVFFDRFPAPPDNRPSEPARPGARRIEPPPLLWDERIVLTRDGQPLGEAFTSWHLPFARSLLVLLNGDRFVGEWYHAVAAYLLANGMLGDATAHLRRAAQELPNDARLVFDRATYAETLGLPIYQAVSDDPASLRPGFMARIPSEDHTNSEAEKLYSRILEIEPGYVEARVRLARLVDRRGLHDEAAAQIANALDAKPSGVVLFYAHLVAGRIAAARGRYDEALAEYRAASAVFPSAQSALLGESHAALMRADIRGTLAPLEHLGAGSMTYDDDPWWDYQLGAGRDVNALMSQLWAHVPRS